MSQPNPSNKLDVSNPPTRNLGKSDQSNNVVKTGSTDAQLNTSSRGQSNSDQLEVQLRVIDLLYGHRTGAFTVDMKKVKALTKYIEAECVKARIEGKIEELRLFGENSGYWDYATDRIAELKKLQEGKQ